MAKRLRTRGVFLALAAGATLLGACVRPAPPPPPPAASCAASAPNSVTSEVRRLANGARASAGLAPLSWSSDLACMADEWSRHMASTGNFAHRNLGAELERRSWSTLGENILRGSASLTAHQMHTAWMNSPGHRANILSGAFSSIGVGTAIGADGRLYATQNFGG